jgi:hypothetical protein
MPELIAVPSVIETARTKPKRIEESAGRVNTRHSAASVPWMVSPQCWGEPGGAEYVAVCLPAFSLGTVHRGN